MRARILLGLSLLIILTLMAACGAKPEVSLPDNHLEPASDPESPTATNPPEPDDSPAATKAPNHMVRIEFVTTGDYAHLNIYNSENIVSANLFSVFGDPTKHQAGKASLGLNQPVDLAKEGAEVGLIVDYEIDSAASDLVMDFMLQSSPINGSVVRIYLLVGEEYQLVHEEEYQRNLLPAGQKKKEFSFDFGSLVEVSPRAQVTPTPKSAASFIVRVELSATADYAAFRILQPEYVVVANFVSSSGEPTAANYYYTGLAINQEKSTAVGGNTIGLTVDYEIAEAAAQEPLNFQLQSGALNTSSVRLSLLLDGQFHQIYNGEYDRLKSPGGKLFKQFSIDLDSMAEMVTTGEQCNLFNGLDLDIYYLDINPGDTIMTLYAQFPDEVIGLQKGRPTMVYGAQLGEQPGLDCRVFDGDQYYGRLYCFHQLESEDKNTAQPWALYVNGCEDPIYEIPQLSISVTPVDTAPSGSKPETADSCGPQPSWKTNWEEYLPWCEDCMKWIIICNFSGGCYCVPPPDELLPSSKN